MLPNAVKVELDKVVSLLIKHGFADSYNFTSVRRIAGGDIAVEYDGKEDISIALKDLSYSDSYTELLKRKQYTLKLLDGAIIQLMYRFDSNCGLLKHRLCFMPSPFNDEFQNEPELYLDDAIYAEVVDRRILPVAIRFDFDPKNAVNVHHPHSHVTMGQYKNCRIPVNSPLSPSAFIEFILRSFYNTAFVDTVSLFDIAISKFENTITDDERGRLHFSMY